MWKQKNPPGKEAEWIPSERAWISAAEITPAWFADCHILDIGNQTYSGDESNQFGLAKDLGSVADRQTIEQIEQHDGDEEDE